MAGVRRLSGAGWLRWSEATREVQLGPRVATWRDPELSTLRELWRLIPTVEKPKGSGAPADGVEADCVEAGEAAELGEPDESGGAR